MDHLKIVAYDIETTPMLLYAWDLRQKFFSINNIVKDKEILMICWKELGKSKIHTLTQLNMTEEEIVASFREVLEDVDILVHQNGDYFDLRNITAKLIEYRLPPLNKIQTIDTYKEARRVAYFSSHKLDFVGGKLLGSRKVDTDFQLWIDCMAGDKKAFKYMARYCRHDVQLLEDYYLRLRPYMTHHPNVASVDTHNCPFCDSSATTINKRYRTKVGIEKWHYRCLSCSAPFTKRAIGHEAAKTRPYSVV
jgi:hypothetical protein